MRLVPIASDGWRFILPSWTVALILFFTQIWPLQVLGAVAAALAIFCTAFFRDFDRKTPLDDGLILSPGDGKILEVSTIADGAYRSWIVARIFLSVFDGHIQRSPIAGEVEDVTYRPGKFLDARDPNAHLENEQNAIRIVSKRGAVVVTQIAGLIARRIVCWVKPKEFLAQGQRFGLIRFGSQVDVLMPPTAEVVVSPGERVVGGMTVLAKWKT